LPPELLLRDEVWDVYKRDEMNFFFSCLPDRMPTLKVQSCHGMRNARESVTLLLSVDRDDSNKQVPIDVGKYL
jgi:hypothetical protein